jgi:hypothetical protein
MEPSFMLDSGREVCLEQLFFSSTTVNVLMGDRRSIRAAVLRALPDTIRSVFWDCKATLILTPDGEGLPRYLFIAHLSCADSVPGQESGDYSRLLVAWFQNDLAGSLVDLAHRALRTLDWDRHAENWID